MRSYAGPLTAFVVLSALTNPSVRAQPGTTVAAHVAAAKTAADDTWLILYSELCGVALGAGGRAASAPRPPGGGSGEGTQAGPPPREPWSQEKVRVFEKM